MFKYSVKTPKKKKIERKRLCITWLLDTVFESSAPVWTSDLMDSHSWYSDIDPLYAHPSSFYLCTRTHLSIYNCLKIVVCMCVLNGILHNMYLCNIFPCNIHVIMLYCMVLIEFELPNEHSWTTRLFAIFFIINVFVHVILFT